MPYTEKDKERRHQYYLKHREETIATNREWRAKNPEKRKEQYRRHNQKRLQELRTGDPEKAKAYREHENARMRAYRSGGSEKASASRERHNAHARAYRSGDSEMANAYRERQKVRHRKYFLEHRDHVEDLRKGRIAWFYDLKKSLKCAVCGQSFPDCPDIIDFHHVKGKESGMNRIGSMVTGKAPKERILAEIEKCTPLCSNCHRKVHYLIKQRKKGKGSAPVPKSTN